MPPVTLLPTAAAAAAPQPLTFLIGKPNQNPTVDITSRVKRETVRIEETGNHEGAHCDFGFIDLSSAQTFIRGRYNLQVMSRGTTLFRGIMGNVRPEIAAIFPDINASARDIGTVLDDQIIKTYGSNGGPIARKNAESDKARIEWLFDLIGPTGPLALDARSKVQQLNASLADQRFPPRLTLRQALERILGAASDSANYYVDAAGRLHTFDDDNPEASIDAPYDINVAASPAGTEVPPIDLEVEWDDSNYFNGYFARAPTKALSQFYTDAHPDLGLSSPFASGIFGDRFTYIDCPDADTAAKVRRVVKAALRDTRNPVPRGSFTVEGARCWNGSVRFQSGQLLYVTSSKHGLNGRSSDQGPWAGARALQPFRIVRNVITPIDGGSNLRMEIEFGGRRPHLYQGGQ